MIVFQRKIHTTMIEFILSRAHDMMRKALDITRNDLSSIRSGRATPALVESIVVAAYSGTQKLKVMEMAMITSVDAKSLLITPYDPSAVSDIARGILEANVGLTPVTDGDVIRITIPSLSSEQRQEYLKLAKAKLEAGRIMIRQIRQEAMKNLRRETEAKTMAVDQQKLGEKKVQEFTDELIAEIDSLGQRKEAELLLV